MSNLLLKSAGNRHLQRMRQAAFRQLDFESILALRSGIAHGCFRRFLEVRFVGRMTLEHRFGLGRAPRFRAEAAEGNASSGYVLTSKVDNHRSRGESELIRRAVA